MKNRYDTKPKASLASGLFTTKQIENSHSMRIGLYGGSFDPIHIGHLMIADTVREARQLDRIVFLPAATAPHKQDQEVTTAKHRLELLELAVGGYAPFAIDQRELERGGVSYTVDTLETIQREQPDDELFLVMGGDSLVDLPSWKSPERICELATPIVIARPGTAPPDPAILRALMPERPDSELQSCIIAMPLIEISSTELRRRVRAGKSIRFRTPRAVEKYI